MKPTDFSNYISDFLTKYLPNERGASHNTIASYRDAFVVLLKFMQDVKGLRIEKLKIDNFLKQDILEFLDYIEEQRSCSISTRNSRLAAIHSFFKYIQGESLDYLKESQKIQSIRVKKGRKQSFNYLTTDAIKLLLQQPDVSTQKGRRDLALLSLLYDSGARVQEIIDLTPLAVRFDKPPVIKLTGKGNKTRLVPMLNQQLVILESYIKEFSLNEDRANIYPLFFNSRKEKLTRQGVNYILKKYTDMARRVNSDIMPSPITCHCIRHSKAMHLLQAGVNLVYIRDILGHKSVQTTEIYARADSKQKRAALESSYISLSPKEEPLWKKNQDLISWLKKF